MTNDWQLLRMMAPGEFLLLLSVLGMSQEACGRYLGVSGRTVRRYAAGEAEIPTASVLLLRAIATFKVKPIVPKRRRL
jgi:transcriptional regulator with XRE-family HTH domain